VLERGALMELARPLARRVLWRLLTEGTGQSPSRALLRRRVLDDSRARALHARHALGGGWILALRARELVLVPPPSGAADGLGRRPARAALPCIGEEPASATRSSSRCPAVVTLEDGRRITAEIGAIRLPTRPVARGLEVELDAA
jgi:hypothetical protein